MSNQQSVTNPTKKPAPAPIKDQKTPIQKTPVQKPAVKKPVPAAIKPQIETAAPAKASAPATKTPAKSITPAPSKTPDKPPPAQQQKSTQAKQLAQFTKKPAQSQQQTSTQQGEKANNWISRTVQNQVQRAGDYAGGFVNSIGDKVNKFGEGVGESISNTTRGWGQGIAGYGNDMKDAVGVGGSRVPTAGNPLGVAGTGSSKGAKAQNSGVRNAGKGSVSNPLGLS